MKRTQDIEFQRVCMELNSALAKIAFLEEQRENSVPAGQYEAKAAEAVALKAENMDYKSLFEFWRTRHFGASSETMVEETATPTIVNSCPTM